MPKAKAKRRQISDESVITAVGAIEDKIATIKADGDIGALAPLFSARQELHAELGRRDVSIPAPRVAPSMPAPAPVKAARDRSARASGAKRNTPAAPATPDSSAAATAGSRDLEG